MPAELVMRRGPPPLLAATVCSHHTLIDVERGRQDAQAKAIDRDKQITDEFEWLSYVLILI